MVRKDFEASTKAHKPWGLDPTTSGAEAGETPICYRTPCCGAGQLSSAGAATSIIFVAINVLSPSTGQVLSRQAYFCRGERRVLSRQTRVCRVKSKLVATKFYSRKNCLQRQNYVRRDKSFVATKICLSRQKYCRDKHTFVATKDVFVVTKTCLLLQKFCRDEKDTYGSSRQ